MKYMKCLIVMMAGLISINHAFAEPKASAGSEGLCQGFEETIEGVWMDASGTEVLLFRYASNADAQGCYAWLNPVAQWNISKAGTDTDGKFTRDGNKREWFWGRDKDGVFVDLSTGTARFVRNGRTTKGKIFH